MSKKMIAALEKAHHELTTLNGLIAFDSENFAPEHAIHINTDSVLHAIDDALHPQRPIEDGCARAGHNDGKHNWMRTADLWTCQWCGKSVPDNT